MTSDARTADIESGLLSLIDIGSVDAGRGTYELHAKTDDQHVARIRYICTNWDTPVDPVPCRVVVTSRPSPGAGAYVAMIRDRYHGLFPGGFPSPTTLQIDHLADRHTWEPGHSLEYSPVLIILDNFDTVLPPVNEPGREIVPTKPPTELLEVAFRDASNEEFETGAGSGFSRTLESLVSTYGDVAIDGLQRILTDSYVSVNVKTEALRQMGLMKHKPTHLRRVGLLSKFLESPNVLVRHAVSVGLSALDDPSVIPALKSAVDREKSELLRHNMEKILGHLQDKLNGKIADRS